MTKPRLIRIELEDRELAFAALVWRGYWSYDANDWRWAWVTTAYDRSAIAAARKTRHAFKMHEATRFPVWSERQVGACLATVEGRRRFSQ